MGFGPWDGHKAYEYTPGWVKEIDYNPDHRPADGDWVVEARGKSYLGAMEVRGLGVLVMRASSNPVTGRLTFNGVSLYPRDMFASEK
jgi:hypothetical protein